jgi:hypothetical protein
MAAAASRHGGEAGEVAGGPRWSLGAQARRAGAPSGRAEEEAGARQGGRRGRRRVEARGGDDGAEEPVKQQRENGSRGATEPAAGCFVAAPWRGGDGAGSGEVRRRAGRAAAAGRGLTRCCGAAGRQR